MLASLGAYTVPWAMDTIGCYKKLHRSNRTGNEYKLKNITSYYKKLKQRKRNVWASKDASRTERTK